MTDSVREVAERFVRDYAGKGIDDVGREILAENFVALLPASDTPLEGRDAHIAMNRDWHDAFPDFDFTVDGVIVDGHEAAVRLSWTGTHEKEVLGVPASGRTVRVARELHVLTIQDGKVVHDEVTFDVGNLINQMEGKGIRPG